MKPDRALIVFGIMLVIVARAWAGGGGGNPPACSASLTAINGTEVCVGDKVIFKWERQDCNGASSPTYFTNTYSSATTTTETRYCLCSGAPVYTYLTIHVSAVTNLSPASVTMCRGSYLTFTALANPSNSLCTPAWGSIPTNAGTVSASGRTAAFYLSASFTNATATLRAICGTTTNSATITVATNNLPTITAQPVPQVACIGQTVTFSVAVTGNPLSYQWRKDGMNLSDNGAWTVFHGTTNATLTISNVFSDTTTCLSIPVHPGGGVDFGSVIAGDIYTYQTWGCATVTAIRTADPDGNTYSGYCTNQTGWPYVAGSQFPCPELVAQSLVGKLGSVDCIQLGSSGRFQVPGTGGQRSLSLLINDNYLGDNSGSWTGCLTRTVQGVYDVIVTSDCGSQISTGATLSISTPCDGIPDWWREQYFGTTTNNSSCAVCDPDGDEVANLYEYLVGTDPTNLTSHPPTVATPTFAPDGGNFATARDVTIGCATNGATIHYTTNGQDPTINDGVIASGGSVHISHSLTLKAKAWKDGLAPSNVKSADYGISGIVVASYQNSFLVEPSGNFWAWGLDDEAQFGRPNTDSDFYLFAYHALPIPLTWVSNSNIVSVAAGHHSTLFALSSGIMGQFGDEYYLMEMTTVLSNVSRVAQGGGFSLALTTNGTVLAWGVNGGGELGLGSYSYQILTPTQVVNLAQVTSIASGDGFSMALRENGTVWAWGDAFAGELGDGVNNLTNWATAKQVSGVSNVIAVAAGSDYGVALETNGTVWAWGDDYSGQLGTGDSYVTDPWRWPAALVSGLSNVVAIAAGQDFTLALTVDGHVYGWGNNYSGQLGTGSGHDYDSTPQLVSGLTDVRAISAGWDHALAVGAYRGVAIYWGWGSNAKGQIGDGTTTQRSTPVIVHVPFDADGDGIPDWQEYQLGTDPLNPDENHDGLLDVVDLFLGYSPTDNDVDGDGFSNAVELMSGTDPFDKNSYPSSPGSNSSDHTPPVITLIEPVDAILLP